MQPDQPTPQDNSVVPQTPAETPPNPVPFDGTVTPNGPLPGTVIPGTQTAPLVQQPSAMPGQNFTPPSSLVQPSSVTAQGTQPGYNMPPQSFSQSSAPQPFGPDNLPGGQVGGSSLKPNRKKLFFGMFAALLVLLLGGGFVFAFYLPNQPSNVFKTGLGRTGQALDKLVADSTSKDHLSSFKKSELILSIEGKLGNNNFTGKLDTKLDATTSNNSLQITNAQTGQREQVLSANLLTKLKEGATFPDIYFQITGLKSLGLDAFIPAITQYEGKWISIDSSYLEKLGISANTLKQSKDNQLTTDDIAELARATSGVVRDYALNSNPKTAIFVEKKYIGKEKVEDGTQAYHFEAGINKENAKNFCSQLITKLAATGAVKKLPGVTAITDEQKKSAVKSCQDSINGIKDDQKFDVWVDAKYKLIYKVRINDDKNPGSYVEFGQIYKGTDDLTLFLNFLNPVDKADTKVTITTNLKTNITKGTATATGNQYSFKASLEAKPYTGDIKADKPATTVPIQDVINTLGLGSGIYNTTPGLTN
jgi:hypothetical protein